MKTVSRDRTYVDYTIDQVGVRVRRSICRPISLHRGRWIEYGVPYSIPVDEGQLLSTKTGISTLASNVRRVEESAADSVEGGELRRLIVGEMEFDDAVSGSLVCA